MGNEEIVKEEEVTTEAPAPENDEAAVAVAEAEPAVAEAPEATDEAGESVAESAEESAAAEETTAAAASDEPAEPVAETQAADAAEVELPAEPAADEGQPQDTAVSDSSDKNEEEDEEDDGDTIFDLQPRQQLTGKVKNITSFGAFVDVGLPQDGLVHISELSKRKVDKVSDVVSVGEEVGVWVKKVDRKRGRISLTMVKPILRRIKDISEEDELEGVVTRIEPYGAFVDIDSERDGLVHISQLTHDYIKSPEEAVSVGDTVKVKVLKVNKKKRQVDLSMKAMLPPPASEMPLQSAQQVEKAVEEVLEDDEPAPTAMAVAFANLQVRSDEDDKSNQGKDQHKHKKEQDEIISRTLATNNK